MSSYISYETMDLITYPCVNSSPPGQNSRRFADDIFKCIFINEKYIIMILISLNFVCTGPIDNNASLV